MVLAIDLLLSAAFSVFLCSLLPLAVYWCIPLFFVFWLVTAVLLVGVYLLTVYLCTRGMKIEPKKRPVLNFFLRATLRSVCYGGRAKINFVGKEKLPEGNFLLVSNHRSMLDPVVTVSALGKHPLGFIAKPEIMGFPLIGRIAQLCNFRPIDRSNPRNAIRTINAAADLIKNGICSVGVYPEGTRNRVREQTLLPFHDGVMMIAQKAQCPIVVVTLENTEKIAKNFLSRSTKVQMTVCEVLSPETVCGMRTGDLSAHVRDVMLEHLK